MDNTFFIIDGHALTYRSFFAFKDNPRINSKGFNTSAIYGFINILYNVIAKESPTHICVVFDTKEPSWRKKIFTEYKANRPKQPQEITESLPHIKDILDALNIRRIEIPGYEADDVIGSLCKNICSSKINTYIMTPDKDYDQLVNDNVFIYKPQRHSFGYEIITTSKVKNKWGIDTPKQVIEMLALIGDNADNIPGIPGVGEKTSSKLLLQYSSIDNIYKNIDSLPEKLKRTFLDNKEQALLCINLATINCNIDVNMKLDDFKIQRFNITKLEEILRNLEIKTLLTKFTNMNIHSEIQNLTF